MIFNYNKNAGKKEIVLKDESFVHIFKARRTDKDTILKFRNLKDNYDYYYQTEEIQKKKAKLILIKKEKIQKLYETKKIHLGWCVIDPKIIKETLPFLNQLGIEKISFIQCCRSQKNFKLKKEKIEKILINSSEQCGRNSIIKIEFIKNIQNFIKKNPDTYLFDFSKNDFKEEKEKINTIIIGPEGGITEKEKKLFKENKIVSLKNNLVLKSETAAIFLSSNLIL